jgi:hypothetical protein
VLFSGLVAPNVRQLYVYDPATGLAIPITINPNKTTDPDSFFTI